MLWVLWDRLREPHLPLGNDVTVMCSFNPDWGLFLKKLLGIIICFTVGRRIYHRKSLLVQPPYS